jgi:hypothetical protein
MGFIWDTGNYKQVKEYVKVGPYLHSCTAILNVINFLIIVNRYLSSDLLHRLS